MYSPVVWWNKKEYDDKHFMISRYIVVSINIDCVYILRLQLFKNWISDLSLRLTHCTRQNVQNLHILLTHHCW